MSHLLDKEIHAEDGCGLSVAYLCGAYPDPRVIPPFTDHGWPERAQGLAEQSVVRWLEQNAAAIFSPPGSHPPDPKSLVWRLIHDPEMPADSKRLNSQYVRINIDRTERYVLSGPGSQRVRIRADGSGFPNLFLAGDWVTTQINAGCVETAVTAGLLASHAICGRPEEIIEPY
jgi:hypothetical protein